MSGLLALATWHASPAGVAVAASQKKNFQSGLTLTQPETPSQKAWLATWQECNGRAPETCRLVELFLSSCSNSGIVDRWLGYGKHLASHRSALDPRSREISLKLTVQDSGGRRREKLNPVTLLTQAAPAKTQKGDLVAAPATQHGLRAQRLYEEWFGSKKLAGRSLQELTPAESARKRMLATKPRLFAVKRKHSDSEKEALVRHSSSVQAVVSRVAGGGVEQGRLGEITLPAASSSSSVKRIVSEQAEAAWSIVKRRKVEGLPRSDSIATSSATSNHHSSSKAASLAAAEPGIVPDSAGSSGLAKPPSVHSDAGSLSSVDAAETAICKQKKVLEIKAGVFAKATSGKPVPYVDANGGHMRPAPSVADQKTPAAFPEFPRNPLVWKNTKGHMKIKIGSLADPIDQPKVQVVVVGSLIDDWKSPAGLLARLVGAWLIDLSFTPGGKDGKGVVFQSVMRSKHFIFWMTPSFQEKYAGYAKVLERCAKASPLMPRDKVPRLVVLRGIPPQTLKFPTLTFTLVTEMAVAVPSNQEEADVKVPKQLDIDGLFEKCTTIVDGRRLR